jgi:hypothetical protein
MNDLLNEEWLSSTGFKWEQLERQPAKHWILWIAPACIDPVEEGRRLFAASDDLGIEISGGVPGKEGCFHCWLRADYGGRYSRFLHVRHLTKISEVVQIIEALAGRKWNPEDVMYGCFHAPEVAARMRKDSERLDRRIAADWGSRVDDNPDQRGIVQVN